MCGIHMGVYPSLIFRNIRYISRVFAAKLHIDIMQHTIQRSQDCEFICIAVTNTLNQTFPGMGFSKPCACSWLETCYGYGAMAMGQEGFHKLELLGFPASCVGESVQTQTYCTKTYYNYRLFCNYWSESNS